MALHREYERRWWSNGFFSQGRKWIRSLRSAVSSPPEEASVTNFLKLGIPSTGFSNKHKIELGTCSKILIQLLTVSGLCLRNLFKLQYTNETCPSSISRPSGLDDRHAFS
mmetsp:Transcript_10890/g.16277  ORF Transcript_10890/g.16277 Transcript_10890/m.16277 type:complete len:110 (-) Transcript_10890:953-1282(-)